MRYELAMILQSHMPIPAYFGFATEGVFEAKPPFVYMDHAYFERGYEKENFRIIFNGIHQTGVIPGLPNRTARLCPFPRDWKQGDHVIVIPPPPNVCKFHKAETWVSETVAELKKHTDRRVIVKPKSGPPLGEFSCWAVVSHSSVAAVEAAYMGTPVFGPETSPAYPVGLSDLSQIESPIFPDRTEWLNTLCWSQFHLTEILSGFAWEAIKRLNNFDERN